VVAPGFYDGIGPPQPYNWTCPPPQAGSNLKPAPGHADVKVVGGVSEAASAYTNDGQVVMGFLPGAFNGDGRTVISVDITPVPACPQPAGAQFVTNIYQITANAPLVKDSNVVLVYSNLEANPSAVYFATDPAGPWKSLPISQQARPYTVETQTRSFGYYAAGNPKTTPPPGAPRVGGGQTLPIIVAAIIVLVVLAGVPLAVLRRRRSPADVDDES
jgi:hypothetical protein